MIMLVTAARADRHLSDDDTAAAKKKAAARLDFSEPGDS